MTFEESWPELSKKLARLLAARRVPHCQRDDIIQETGLRLLRAWDRIDPDQGPWGLARTIALHAIADGTTTRGRYELAELTELPDHSDAERAGIARFHLSSVRRALMHMSSTDRVVLLAEVGGASPPRLGRSALKMARSRARQRLRGMVEKPGLWAGLRHLPFRLRVAYERRYPHERALMYPHLAESAMAMVALVLTVTAINGRPNATDPLRSDDAMHNGRAVNVSETVSGRDRAHGRPLRRAAEISAIRGGTEADDDDRASGAHWLKESADLASRDAERARRDAEQLRKEAEFIAGLAEEEAGRLGNEAEFIAGLAAQEAKNAKQFAEDLRP